MFTRIGRRSPSGPRFVLLAIAANRLHHAECSSSFCLCLQFDALTRPQRETAVAHSQAAWERLKDVFTLSESPGEVIDSENSLGHRMKVGWNNGAHTRGCCRWVSNASFAGVRGFRDTVRELFEK